MRWKRGVKIYKVQSVNTELEELSKLNKDNVVRVMDRSAERTGDKLSSESGLYIPKRDPQEQMMKEIEESFEEAEFAPRKINFQKKKEIYQDRKSFATEDEYSDENRFWEYDEQNEEAFRSGYDEEDEKELENPESYSVAAFFSDRPAVVRSLEPEEDPVKDPIEDQAAQLRRKANGLEHEEEAVSALMEQFGTETASARMEQFGAETASARMEQFGVETAAAQRPKEQEELDEKPSMKDAAAVQKKFTFPEKEETMQEETLSPEKERQLKSAMKKIQGAATPKERLAAEREAIRLGMVDVLVESDGSSTVRPEILDEMGFTPGGDKKTEVVKNRRFWFRRKEKAQTESVAETKSAPRTHANTNKRSEPSRSQKRAPIRKESRSAIMRNAEERNRYVIKIKTKLEKAKKDYGQMQKNYDELTDCINDLVLLKELPEDVANNIRRSAQQILRYQKEQERLKKNRDMEDGIYLKMAENSKDMPSIINRLGEDEAYVSKVKAEIDRLEGEKAGCRIEKEEVMEQRRRTKQISIAVIAAMLFTITVLVVLQFASELDMQLPILLFGVCAILITLSIFVRYFRTENNETINTYALNKIIKKQNQEKAKYVTALNGVEYVYHKYHIHSSGELLYQWEKYQRVSQDRENYKSAVREVKYYEERLQRLLDEYGLQRADIWVNQAGYLVENREMDVMKEGMEKKRNQLKRRMEKCRKVMAKLNSELSVLVIKFPQYAEEIKGLLAK